jgi:hypothetical protein
VIAVALAAALVQTLSADDAKTVVSTATEAMGVEGLNSIHYYGVAQSSSYAIWGSSLLDGFFLDAFQPRPACLFSPVVTT